MKISFPIEITAADTNKRTISGKIVTWDEQGSTSAGLTVFEKDSIDFSKPVKLLLEHQTTKPLGKLVDITATDSGLEATFRLAKTFRADDALEEAATGLRDGFSVGVKINEWKNVEGVLRIQSSTLQEVSLVTDPAIDSARVAEVAASETPTENSEATAEETTTEENKVSEITSEAPIATEAVEAAQAPVVTANYVAYTKPRVDTNVTAGQYLTAQVRAIQGDTDARDLVAALQIATVSENTGSVPPNYLRDAIGIIDASRPFIDSIERAPLPATGMKIFTPVLGTQATVAQTAEGVEFSSTDTTVTYQENDVVKFAGANVVNVELFDRSEISGGSFADLLVRELAASYAQKTDAYAAKIAVNACGSTSDSTIYKAIAKGIADSYNVMRFTPNRLMVAPSGGEDGIDFAGLLGAVDGSQRPLFAAAAPQNAGGLMTQGSTAGTIAGLDLVVDPNYTGDNSNVKYGLVYPSAAMRFHESPRIELRANIVANGRIEIGLYGYVAVVNRYPTAFRGLSVA
jgi:HK97 family phage prohead protease